MNCISILVDVSILSNFNNFVVDGFTTIKENNALYTENLHLSKLDGFIIILIIFFFVLFYNECYIQFK